MHVAVAIVSFQNPADVLNCLRSLAGATHADFEVIICENGSNDAYQALIAQLPTQLPGGQQVRAISAPHNPGFAGGVNLCLAATPGADAWWVLNPDTEPMPEAMAALARRLSRGDCDMAGATLLSSAGHVQAYGGRWRSWFGRCVSLGMYNAPDHPVDRHWVEGRQNYIVGASMMLTRGFLAKVGPMREDYFLYCEEVEWSVRGARSGCKLGFAPGAVVMHHQGTTTGAGGTHRTRSRLSVYLSSRNMILMTRDLYPWRLLTATLAVLAASVLVYARRRAWAQAGYQIAGALAGIANERGVPAWLRPRH
ncbi:MAG: glycosyltransferase family 2 protein [Sphingomonadales bacterium]|jgi:GT2 family glycosyltransferase